MRRMFLIVAMAAFLAAGGCGGNNEPTVSSFVVNVDYSISLEQMIVAGNYCWANTNINDNHFPVSKPNDCLSNKAEITIELVHLNKRVSSDDAITELKKRGLRPATIPELLAFGAKYPNEQKKYPIVALGSVWRFLGGSHVTYLWYDVNEYYLRYLNTRWLGRDWSECCRFAAVPE